MSTRRVPWSSTAEWIEVYNWTYNGDGATKSLASKRLAAWRSRGTLPASVDATGAFLDAMCCDGQSAGMMVATDMHVRCTYGIALMRFVNAITEFDQTGVYAQSVQRLAARLGIPEWIVDARHSVAHNDLPGTELLRGAAEFCMFWLKENYWMLQLNQWTEAESRVTDAVRQYSERAVEALETRRGKKKGGSSRASGTQVSGVAELSKLVTESLPSCSESFSIHRLLVDELLKISQVLLAEGQAGYAFPSLSSAISAASLPRAPSIPDRVLTACWPLLKWCQLVNGQPALFPSLLEEFARRLGTCPPVCAEERERWWRVQVLASSWILSILAEARRTKFPQQRLIKVKGALDAGRLLRCFLCNDGDGECRPDGCGMFCADIVTSLLLTCPVVDAAATALPGGEENDGDDSADGGQLAGRIRKLARAASHLYQAHLLQRSLEPLHDGEACCQTDDASDWSSCAVGVMPGACRQSLDLPAWFDDCAQPHPPAPVPASPTQTGDVRPPADMDDIAMDVDDGS